MARSIRYGLASAIADRSIPNTKIVAGSLTNTEMSASAAIAYSKLNLANSVQSTDILNPTTTITGNATVFATSSTNVKTSSVTTKAQAGSAAMPNTKVKEIVCKINGTVKVSLTVAPTAVANFPYAIFKNGTQVAGATYASGTADETITQDVSVVYGDLIQAYFSAAGGTYTGITANFKTFSVAYDAKFATTPSIALE